ncbi:MAG: RHS repeat-associated core domain-containing protein [Salinivirgaceae bacterium]
MSHPRKTEYDALNRPLTQTMPDNTVIEHTYNEAGLLETVKKDSQTYVSNINYNEKGQRTAIYYGNGSKTKYEYDPNTFRLKRLLTTRNAGADILQDLNYTYDPVGNIVEVVDNAQETTYYDNAPVHPKKQYTYDALYRLKSGNGRELAGLAKASAGGYFADSASAQNTQAVHQFMQQYTYDQLGNIQEIKHTVGSDPSKNWTRGYVYDESTNKLLKHDSAQTLDDYTYDAHGNITSMPHLTLMEWDHEDMLIKSTKGTESTYYRYDATGERVRKITVKQNGDKNERLYFGNYEIYREIENGNDETNPKKERQTVHISDDTTRIAMVEKLTTENGSAVSNPVEVVRYQLNDHLGSASVELNENADIISYEEYHPFGTTSYQKHNTDISQKRYKYVGKERDEETGLYNYGFRLYAPWLGRFISVDPMAGERSWVNPYNYCQNNPINRIDPTGALDDDPPKGVDPALNNVDGSEIENNSGSKLLSNPHADEPSITSSVKKTKDNNSLGVKIRGFDQNIIAEEIDKLSDLTITWDSETQRLLASGEAVTDKDILLFEAINNSKIEVNLLNSDQDIVTVDGNMALNDIGGFGGNREISDSSGKKTVKTMQFFNLKQAKQEQNEGGNKIGTNAIHEILESYIAAKMHPNVKAPVNANNTPANANAYLESHKRASDIDPDFI